MKKVFSFLLIILCTLFIACGSDDGGSDNNSIGSNWVESTKDTYECYNEGNTPKISKTSKPDVIKIIAPKQGSGATVSHLEITNSAAAGPKYVTIITADSLSALNAQKALYTNCSAYAIEIGDERGIWTENAGLGSNPNLTWATSDSEVVAITPNGYGGCGIKGLKAGDVTVTVSCNGVYTCDWEIKVLREDQLLSKGEQIYFTTYDTPTTVLCNGKDDNGGYKDKEIRVNPNNAMYSSSFEDKNISWESSDEDIVEVVPNGRSATLKPKKDGHAVITVSHPLSHNTLEINVVVGSEMITQNGKEIDASYYLTTTENCVFAKIGDKDKIAVGFSLKGLNDIDINDCHATVENKALDDSNKKVAEITFLPGTIDDYQDYSLARSATVSKMADATWGHFYGKLKYLNPGTATITVSHPKVAYPLKIVVKVLPSDAYLKEPYTIAGHYGTSSYTGGIIGLVNGNGADYTVKLGDATDEEIAKFKYVLSYNGTQQTIDANSPQDGDSSSAVITSGLYKVIDGQYGDIKFDSDGTWKMPSHSASYGNWSIESNGLYLSFENLTVKPSSTYKVQKSGNNITISMMDSLSTDEASNAVLVLGRIAGSGYDSTNQSITIQKK